MARTELSELGEFGLIKRLTEKVALKNPESIAGVGDDAAIIDNKDLQTLITHDLLIEGVHFDLSYIPLAHLGYKTAVVNFSDIAAMNGVPKQLIIGLGVSNRFPVEALDEIYSGILKACEIYKVDLVGGDTVSSNKGLILSGVAVGNVAPEKATYRNGAKLNDLVCVSGNLGGAYCGLMVLEREKQVYLANPEMQPELEGYEYVLERQLKPEARTDIVKLLAEKDILPTSMIDISDGLASEILHIATSSGLGCRLYEDKIPVHPDTIDVAKEFSLDPTICALNGGEEYELLFTVKQEDYEKISEMEDISIIGHMSDKSEGFYLVTRSGTVIELNAQGWDAFLHKDLK